MQGALMAALAATKNTAFADVNDAVTAVNEPVLDAALRTRRILALLEEVLAHLALRPARMMAAAAEGFGTATELADVIVREAGLSFRMAHSIVAVVVRDALAAGRQAGAITAADLDAAAEGLFGRRLGIPAAAVAQALDPAENIRSRTVLGGPAPGEMARMLAARDAALARDAAAVVAVQDRIGTARQRCFALAEAMARGEARRIRRSIAWSRRRIISPAGGSEHGQALRASRRRAGRRAGTPDGRGRGTRRPLAWRRWLPGRLRGLHRPAGALLPATSLCPRLWPALSLLRPAGLPAAAGGLCAAPVYAGPRSMPRRRRWSTAHPRGLLAAGRRRGRRLQAVVSRGGYRRGG
ncbi:hypothetical protein ACFQY5_07010 [Paeniroseomonas aquatica]|uniref:hypothetical protein n=1 Tax=Paeniroseomonas aquatica TaxID=373043 RepID=UPI003620958E